MPAHSSVSKLWQAAKRRIVLCCGFVGLVFLAIVGFILLHRQAPANILAPHQVSAAPTKIMPRPQVSALPARAQPKLVANYGKLPLSFEANQGQAHGPVRFLTRGLGFTLFLTGDEALFSLQNAAGVAPTFWSAHTRLEPGHTAPIDRTTIDSGRNAGDGIQRAASSRPGGRSPIPL